MDEVARRYYPNTIQGVRLPCALGHGVTLHDPAQLSASSTPITQYHFCAAIEGVEERNALSWFHAFEDAIHLHSGTSFPESYTITQSGIEDMRAESSVGWSGYRHVSIDEAAVHFAARTLPDLEHLMLAETFNRVSNAMRLYDSAQISHNPDFALLGFIGCLESLFSVAPQELSFRLCVSISKFSRDTPEAQRAYFSELKQLYTIRSKVAHGDKLDRSEEKAAIQLVEHWVPMAANACRAVLFRLIDQTLIPTFNGKRSHEQLLEHLLFYSNLTGALTAVRTNET